jgi:YD repeat-containing protein
MRKGWCVLRALAGTTARMRRVGTRGRLAVTAVLAMCATAAIFGPTAAESLGASASTQSTSASGKGAPSTPHVLRELPELKTADSNTFLRSDGSREVSVYDHAVNFQTTAGQWTPINDELQQASDGSFHPAASPVPLTLPSSLAAGPISVGQGESALSFALQGAAPGPASAAGTNRTYAGVLPGVEASYAATPQGVRELLTLSSASAPTVYNYKLSYASGLHPTIQPGGDLVFRDGSGKTVYTLAAPTVEDSAKAKSLPTASAVHYELSSDGTVLSLVLDKTWLDSSSRVFPVRIDPDIYFSEEQDCTIANGADANASLCGGRLHVGVESGSSSTVARSLLHFELSSIPRGSVILSSNFQMLFEEEYASQNPLELEVFGLSRSFTPGATWNSFNGTEPWSAAGGDYATPAAGRQELQPEYHHGWVSFGFAPLVEHWVQEPSSNHGILLKASNESTAGYDSFIQGENREEQPGPLIDIVYSPRLGNQEGDMVTGAELAGGAELSVNVADGNMLLESPDVEYSGEGYETKLARYYNSQDEDLVGSGFGPGWLLGKGDNTLLYPAWWDKSNVFHEPGGAYSRFDPSTAVTASANPWQLTYKAPPGQEATLTPHEDGTRTLTNNETGTEWLFDGSENGFPQQIVEHEGSGNTLSLGYTNSELSSLSDSHGDAVTIQRDHANERVTKIEGTGGKTWSYGYGSNNELSSYENPEGQKTSYSYNGWGLLSEIQDSSGTYVISYEPSHPVRVTSVRRLVNGTVSTPGSEDETTSFEYISPQSPTCNPETDAGETIVRYKPGEEGTEAYCYDAAGEITNWTGPEAESETDPTEATPVEQEETPVGACYETPAPVEPGRCGEEDVPPESETLQASPTEVQLDPSLGPTHYGIADNNGESAFDLFTNPWFKKLGVVNVRRIVPWNVVWEAKHGNGTAQSELEELQRWVRGVKALGNGTGQPTVSFENPVCNANESWVSPVSGAEVPCTEKREKATGKARRAPTEQEYTIAVKQFLEETTLKEVIYFTPWNEPNFPAPGKPAAKEAGRYWRELDYLCNPQGPLKRSCQVAAGEFADTPMPDANDEQSVGGRYFHEYKLGMGHPRTAFRWAWHSYSDGQETAGRKLGKPGSWWQRFKHFMEAIDKATPVNHEVWLTEQGVIYNEQGTFRRPLLHGRGDGGTAAKRIIRAYVEDGRYGLTHQGTKLSHIKRFFYYEMRGEPDQQGEPEVAPNVRRKFWDSGLLFPPGTYPGNNSEPTTPRHIYYIYKQKTPG